MLCSLWLGLALAGDLEDLRERVEADTWIDWTTMEVEVHGTAMPSGVDSSRKVVETTARRSLGAKIERAVDEVRVYENLAVEDLRDDSAFDQVIARRVARWAVSEARYYASGRVELIATLSIGELLKPWSLERARPSPTESDGLYTGWVLDARGSGFKPVFAPTVTGPGGEKLYDGLVWSDAPPRSVAVVYVVDPAHVAAARAGETPLLSMATSTRAGELVVDEETAAKAREGLLPSRVLGLGRVVVVVDP